MAFNFPEECKLVLGAGLTPIQAANTSAIEYICCKNVQKAWAIITHYGANDTDLTLEFSEATDVAGTSAADVTKTFPIWRDNDAGTGSDTLAKQTDAATVVIDPATQNPVLVVMEWDPAKFSAGFDCVGVKGNSGHASNNVHILWVLQMRYADNQPPTVITD